MNRWSKYGARKTICNQGHKHASKKEAQRCDELTLLEKAGEIANLEQQPKNVLQDGFLYKGKKIRPITYTADFRYWDVSRKVFVIEDTKGYRTPVYRLKKKLLLFSGRYDDSEIFEES